jgi:phosphate transport system substrate-binding protein
VKIDEARERLGELAAAAERLRNRTRKPDRPDESPAAADVPPPAPSGSPETSPVENVPPERAGEVAASAPAPIPKTLRVREARPIPTAAVGPPASTLPMPEARPDSSPAIDNAKTPVLPIIGGLVLLLLAALFFGWRTQREKPRPRVALVTAPRAIPKPEVILRLHGSNTIGAQLGPNLVKAFFQDQGATDIRVIPVKNDETAVQAVMPGDSSPRQIEIDAHGSATAFTDFARNLCDIGMASRKINTNEAAQLSRLGDMTLPSSEHVLGLDGIAVIVNAANPIQSLTRDQIAGIFAGVITNWEQVLSPRGTIHVYARNSKSGTYDTFQNLVLGSRSLMATVARIEDSRELSDRVAADPDGIGSVGLPYIRSARAVAVSDAGTTPLLPTRLTVSTEDYVLSRRLYLYTPARPANAFTSKFLSFALSRTGQKAVADSGFVPLIVEAEAVAVPSDAPPEYQRLTSGAERLSLDFRFRSSSAELDNKALADLDRVVASLGDLKLSAQNVILIGFADSTGIHKSNANLSEDRARAVAEKFAPYGLTPKVVTGFGSAMPVSSNATPDGREKNRRVEIWVKK